MGIANARSDQLEPIAKHISNDEHSDFTTQALRLFILARHGMPISGREWDKLSDIVQGVGNFGDTMRLQLGWAYLKHKGQAKHAITQALR